MPRAESEREMIEWMDLLLNDQLQEAGQAALEKKVLSDPEARRLYVQYMHLNADLHWRRGRESRAGAGSDSVLKILAAPEAGGQAQAWKFPLRLLSYAALLIVGLSVGYWITPPASDSGSIVQTPRPVAYLVDAKRCRWESISGSTEAGSELKEGRLKLQEGLARLRFASGALVTLQGPAELEIRSPMLCLLHAGMVVAEVPDEAHGFTIETPHARLVDQGTEFGVSVDEQGQTALQVFRGRVDVTHAMDDQDHIVTEGQEMRIGEKQVQLAEAGAAEPTVRSPASDPESGWVSVTTAQGQGKEQFVHVGVTKIDPPGILGLKHGLLGWDRKVYLGFDLQILGSRPCQEAELVLNFVPTGRGYASYVPDATFIVYGLKREDADGWVADTLDWTSAPANAPAGNAVDPDQVVELGRFVVEQGVLWATRKISGSRLTEFLNSDTNGTATLIVVRDTRETRSSGLVHGIASREHPVLSPPTLRAKLR